MSLEGLTAEHIESLALLSKGIAEDPKTRLRFQALVREKYPDANTPELDAAMAMKELEENRKKDREEFDQYKAEQEARTKEMQEWAEVVGAGHCKYEDIPAVVSFMTDNGITNKTSGAKYWSQSKTLAEPSAAQTRTFDMPNNFIDRWKQSGAKGLNQMARDEAYAALQEFRSGKVV